MPYRHARNTVSGQLILPTLGSSGGILMGGSVNLYRGAANKLYLGVNDDLLIQADKKIYFRDEAIYIHSGTDGELNIVADSALRISPNSVYINEYLIHEGDTNTYIRYRNDRISLIAGGVEMINFNATTLGFFAKAAVTQPVHLADPTDLATCITAITQLIDNQKALGLMAADP